MVRVYLHNASKLSNNVWLIYCQSSHQHSSACCHNESVLLGSYNSMTMLLMFYSDVINNKHLCFQETVMIIMATDPPGVTNRHIRWTATTQNTNLGNVDKLLWNPAMNTIMYG